MLLKLKDFFTEKLEDFWKNPIMKRIITNSAYLFSAGSLRAVMGLFQGKIIVTAILAPSLGLLYTVRQLTNSANRLASFRIHEFVIKYVREFEENNQPEKAAAAFKLAILLELIGALFAIWIVSLLAPWATRVFAKEWIAFGWLPANVITNMFVMYSIVILVNFMMDSSTGLLHVFNRFNRISQLSVFEGVITLGLFFAAARIDANLNVYLGIFIISKMIMAAGTILLAFVACYKRWGWKWMKAPIKLLWPQKKEILTFVLSTNLSGTISMVAKDNETLWISGFSNTTVSGYYTIAQKFIGILQMPIGPLSNSTFPEITREFAKRNFAGIRKTLSRGSILSGAYTLLATIGLILFGDQIISWYTGVENSPAYSILMILLIGYAFTNIFYWNRFALLAFNHPAYLTTVNFFVMIIKTLAIIFLFEKVGILLFAALLSGYYILTVSFAVAKVRRELLTNLTSID